MSMAIGGGALKQRRLLNEAMEVSAVGVARGGANFKLQWTYIQHSFQEN